MSIYNKTQSPEEYAFLFDITYYRTTSKTPKYRKMKLVSLSVGSTTIIASFSNSTNNSNEQISIRVDVENKRVKFKNPAYYTSLPELFADNDFHDEQFKKQKAQSMQKYPQYFL